MECGAGMCPSGTDMGLERNLDDWVAAGLISADQAGAIRAHAARHSRPWGLWAVVGLGGLAILLGLMALVAANWADIPAGLKLALHFLLNLAAGWAVVVASRQGRALWLELALFLFTGLVLTGIALTGQVFQMSSAPWRPLAFWLALTSPLLLLAGQGRATAWLWIVIVGATLGGVVEEFHRWFADHRWAIGLPLTVPALLVLLGDQGSRQTSRHASRHAFWQAVRLAGLQVVVIVASLMPSFVWYQSLPDQHDYARDLLPALPILLGATALAIAALLRKPEADRGGAGVLGLATLLPILPMLLPLAGIAGELAGALAFTALWAAIAWAAQRRQRAGLFRLAVGVIALRLIIIYFEVFGSLATTGVGLIVSGLLVIGAAVGTTHLLRRWRIGAAS